MLAAGMSEGFDLSRKSLPLRFSELLGAFRRGRLLQQPGIDRKLLGA